MSRWLGRSIVLGALVVATLLMVLVLGSVGPAVHDAASLPGRISICGRDWSRDGLDRRLSLAAIRARDGVEPVVVDPGLFASCPAGACTSTAQDVPCATVIYARVGEDAYVDYALQGGP
jgi:hypothetical protein